MQLSYAQLDKQLKNKALSPIYLISGEEILLVQTACDAIRTVAKEAGFSERIVFYADTDFNWPSLIIHSHHYGLFAEKQLLELRLLQGIPESGAQILQRYANDPPPHKIMLIVTGKLDRRAQQSTWFKSIDKVGLSIPIWPIPASQLTEWITQRLYSTGLKIEKEAITCLILATEGNLLATAQTIEKLSLYLDATTKIITSEIMLQALHDSAHFDPFQLTDAALQGKPHRCLRILHRLKEEGTEPLLILWALSRECRQLASLAFQQARGKPLKTLFQEQRIWEKRQWLLQQALQRHSLAHWYQLIRLAAKIDQRIKGISSGNVWNALETLSIRIARAKL